MPTVQERLGITEHIIRRSEQSGMARDAPHRKRIRVVDFPPNDSLSPGAVFRAGNPAPQSDRQGGPLGPVHRRGEESRFLHPQRFPDLLLAENIQGLTTHCLNEFAQDNEIEVTIDSRLAGFMNQRRTKNSVDNPRTPLRRAHHSFTRLPLTLNQKFMETAPRPESG